MASVISKVFEIIILNRVDHCFVTLPNQFGFKKGLGTDQCIYVLKELVSAYNALNGSVFACFLDASKAFDRVNHVQLFDKLVKRGVPGYIIRILIYWYSHQLMCVRWGNEFSSSFTVSNGVRQGGILSPYLFNVYVDDLSCALNTCAVGCYISSCRVNHLMYADDLVLLAPSVGGLNKLLRCCERFGSSHDIKFNCSKSAIICFKSGLLAGANLPSFQLNGSDIKEVTQYKYLGHILSSDLSDNADIDRQRKQLYARANSVLRKFHMCTVDVKLRIFDSFCTPMYASHLWWKFKISTFNKLNTSYHNMFKRFLGFSKFESTSLLCTIFDFQCCKATIRKHIFRFFVSSRCIL